ncbi:MAG TPA: zinc metalloprotease HtpX [Candidatus Competibacteraceae bacterium]|nr:zinc metalloprotease HtpX [Candidatus Competibacteraceae bacterium]
MRRDTWLHGRFVNGLQSIGLLAMLGGLMAYLAWVLAGPLFAVLAVAGVVWLYAATPAIAGQLVLAVFRCRPLTYHEAPGLHQLLQLLAGRAGLPRVPQLYYLPSAAMNAFTVGGREQAAIAMSDGMLRRMDGTELAGVLAHEISHLRHGDVRVMTFADLVSRVTKLLSTVGQFLILINLPLLLLGAVQLPWLPVLVLAFAPLASDLIQLALSRVREYDADLGAAELLGDPLPLVRALDKLERYQGGWLERLFGPGRRMSEPSLLRTHPPTEERIRRLLALRESPEFRAALPAWPPHLPEEQLFLGDPPPRQRWRRGGFWF